MVLTHYHCHSVVVSLSYKVIKKKTVHLFTRQATVSVKSVFEMIYRVRHDDNFGAWC